MYEKVITVLKEVMDHMAHDEDCDTYNPNVYERVSKLHAELVQSDAMLAAELKKPKSRRAKG